MGLDLSGKAALVTGGGNGIGLAIARALRQAGMKVAIADIDQSRLDAAMDEGDWKSRPSLAVQFDIADRQAWTRAADHIERELGPVQVLCNNAGAVIPQMPICDLSPEGWNWMIAVNLSGAFNGVHEIVGRLKARGLPGHIVNTASASGLHGAPGFAAYTASKFGVVGFSEALRMELAADTIGVSVLCPGAVRTGMGSNWRRVAPEFVKGTKGWGGRGATQALLPDQVADQVLRAIQGNTFYILTHPGYLPLLHARHEALEAALGREPTQAETEDVCRLEGDAVRAYQEWRKIGVDGDV